MATTGWQETLGNALEVVNNAGLVILVQLAPLITGILLFLLAAWVIRRQVGSYKLRIASGATKVLKEAGKLGTHAVSGAANVASTAANQTATAFQEYALPAAKSAVQAAAPHVTGAAKTGADQASEVVAKAMPIAKDVAGATYGVTKTTVTALGIMAQVKSAEFLDKARAAQKRREESSSSD